MEIMNDRCKKVGHRLFYAGCESFHFGKGNKKAIGFHERDFTKGISRNALTKSFHETRCSMKRIRLTLCLLLAAMTILMMAGCTSGNDVSATAGVLPTPEEEGPPTSAAASSESGPEEMKAEYRKITAEDAKAMMDAGDVIVLDVRTKEEYDTGHIEKAVLLPDYEVAARAETVLPDRNAVILVYCRSGRRSELAARALVDQGYSGVYDFGGIVDWPYDTVKE